MAGSTPETLPDPVTETDLAALEAVENPIGRSLWRSIRSSGEL
jgi:hypothetical protein